MSVHLKEMVRLGAVKSGFLAMLSDNGGSTNQKFWLPTNGISPLLQEFVGRVGTDAVRACTDNVNPWSNTWPSGDGYRAFWAVGVLFWNRDVVNDPFLPEPGEAPWNVSEALRRMAAMSNRVIAGASRAEALVIGPPTPLDPFSAQRAIEAAQAVLRNVSNETVRTNFETIMVQRFGVETLAHVNQYAGWSIQSGYFGQTARWSHLQQIATQILNVETALRDGLTRDQILGQGLFVDGGVEEILQRLEDSQQNRDSMND